jgi:hypothetical protein
MLEWLVAIAALVLFLALLPRMLRRTKAKARQARKSSGGSGVMIGLGLAFAMIFDPKASQATEVIDQKQEESEDAGSGAEP